MERDNGSLRSPGQVLVPKLALSSPILSQRRRPPSPLSPSHQHGQNGPTSPLREGPTSPARKQSTGREHQPPSPSSPLGGGRNSNHHVRPGSPRYSPRFGSPPPRDLAMQPLTSVRRRQEQSKAAHLARQSRSARRGSVACPGPPGTRRPNPLLRGSFGTRAISCHGTRASVGSCGGGAIAIGSDDVASDGSCTPSFNEEYGLSSHKTKLQHSLEDSRTSGFDSDSGAGSSPEVSPRGRVAALCDQTDRLIHSMSAFIRPPVPPPTTLADPRFFRDSSKRLCKSATEISTTATAGPRSTLGYEGWILGASSSALSFDTTCIGGDMSELRERISVIERELESVRTSSVIVPPSQPRDEPPRDDDIAELKKQVERTQMHLSELLGEVRETKSKVNMLCAEKAATGACPASGFPSSVATVVGDTPRNVSPDALKSESRRDSLSLCSANSEPQCPSLGSVTRGLSSSRSVDSYPSARAPRRVSSAPLYHGGRRSFLYGDLQISLAGDGERQAPVPSSQMDDMPDTARFQGSPMPTDVGDVLVTARARRPVYRPTLLWHQRLQSKLNSITPAGEAAPAVAPSVATAVPGAQAAQHHRVSAQRPQHSRQSVPRATAAIGMKANTKPGWTVPRPAAARHVTTGPLAGSPHTYRGGSVRVASVARAAVAAVASSR